MEKETKDAYPFEHGLSPVTAKLVDLLQKGVPGDILTDEIMTQHCGRDTRVKGNGYNNLQTAISRVERFHRLVWRREATVGCIRCLTDHGMISVGNSNMDKIRRKTRRTKRVLALVDIETLTENEQKEFMAKYTQIGTVELMLKPQVTAKLLMKGVTDMPELSKLLQSFEKIA